MNLREARREKKLIHFYLLNNFLSLRKNTTAVAKTVSDLKKFGIDRSFSSLTVKLIELKNHPEIHTLPSLIKKEPSLNREGKDKMYAAFWRMVEMEAQDVDTVVYFGLPSNQIGFVWQQLKKIGKPANLFSFELDTEKAQWQEEYAAQFLKDEELIEVCVLNEDILNPYEWPDYGSGRYDMNWEILSIVLNDLIDSNGSGCLTILDLDLMKNGTPELARKIAGIIPNSDRTIVNITTCIGRKITKQEYIHSFKEVLQKEIEQSHKVKYWFSDKYVDNIIPMVWEHISLGGK